MVNRNALSSRAFAAHDQAPGRMPTLRRAQSCKNPSPQYSGIAVALNARGQAGCKSFVKPELLTRPRSPVGSAPT